MRAAAVTLTILLGTAVAPTPGTLAGLIPSAEQIAEWLTGLGPALQVPAIIAGTLISEDATCVAVGTLIAHGKVNWLVAGGACFLGIYIGDLLFFFLGRAYGRRLLNVRFFSRSLGAKRLEEFGAWFDRRPWAAILAARFLPGLRVPLYVSVGALTKRTWAFFWWTCFFAFVWTPVLIAAVAFAGKAVTKPFEYITGGHGWLAILLAIVAIYLMVRGVILMSTAEGRAKIAGRFKWITGGRRARTVRQEPGAAVPDAADQPQAAERSADTA